jgi:hypothetical protein
VFPSLLLDGAMQVRRCFGGGAVICVGLSQHLCHAAGRRQRRFQLMWEGGGGCLTDWSIGVLAMLAALSLGDL